MKRLSIILILLLYPVISWACKEAMLVEAFPITDFKEYSTIVVVNIDQSIHSDNYRYKPLVSFKATVLENIKGDLIEGILFTGKPKKEQARAVCPVHLTENGKYLLLLTKESGEYVLSRFSFPVESNNKYFSNYISQIKDAVKTEQSMLKTEITTGNRGQTTINPEID